LTFPRLTGKLHNFNDFARTAGCLPKTLAAHILGFRVGTDFLKPSMSINRVSYTLDSTLESVNTAEETAQKMAAKAGFAEDESHQIAMSVREAAVNAVLHGNAYDPQKKMRMSIEQSGDAFIVSIADEGKGLKPEEVPNPLAQENILKQSGRGIFLIKSFMDEVRFRQLDPGTEITLIKHVHGNAANNSEERQ
jgi:serine/threonine-protein kinase RsbW